MSLTWVDNVTPLNAVNMSKLVQEDEVVVAATRIVASKLAAGDTQPAFRILGDGKQEWGPGGSTAPDTNLYRTGANVLKTDDEFQAGAGTGNSFVGYGHIIQNNGSMWLRGDANIYFGAADDTNLYRWGADMLKTDDNFVAAGHLYADGGAIVKQGVTAYNTDSFWQTTMGYWAGAPGPGIAFSAANDTTLSRAGAAILETNAWMNVKRASTTDIAVGVQTSGDATQRLYIYADGSLRWGPGSGGYDAVLSRSAAYELQVDRKLRVQGPSGTTDFSGLALVFDGVASGAARLVGVGAADSGGSGYRMLRVFN